MLSALIFHCITINLLNILSKGTFLLPEPYLLLFLSQLEHSVHLPSDTPHLPQDRYHLYNEVCVNYVLPQLQSNPVIQDFQKHTQINPDHY